MNGFKTGFEVRINGIALHPRDFFAYACPHPNVEGPIIRDLKPLHRKKLVTLYPRFYKEIYNQEGFYYKAIAAFFKVTHAVNKHDITCITIEPKDIS